MQYKHELFEANITRHIDAMINRQKTLFNNYFGISIENRYLLLRENVAVELAASQGSLKKAKEKAVFVFVFGIRACGNKKLKDNDSFAYSQWNLPALKTCPFASHECIFHCYADREAKGIRKKTIVPARERNLNTSLQADFSFRMIYSFASYLLYSRKYKQKIMTVRVHESGDIYCQRYLRDWLTIIDTINKCFPGRATFHFYTKSFKYFLDLNENEKQLVRKLMRKSVLTLNLSLDISTNDEQLERAKQMLVEFPLCNTYTFAKKADEAKAMELVKMITAFRAANYHFCKCRDCANCAICNHAGGIDVFVIQHN